MRSLRRNRVVDKEATHRSRRSRDPGVRKRQLPRLMSSPGFCPIMTFPESFRPTSSAKAIWYGELMRCFHPLKSGLSSLAHERRETSCLANFWDDSSSAEAPLRSASALQGPGCAGTAQRLCPPKAVIATTLGFSYRCPWPSKSRISKKLVVGS